MHKNAANTGNGVENTDKKHIYYLPNTKIKLFFIHTNKYISNIYI